MYGCVCVLSIHLRLVAVHALIGIAALHDAPRQRRGLPQQQSAGQ